MSKQRLFALHIVAFFALFCSNDSQVEGSVMFPFQHKGNSKLRKADGSFVKKKRNSLYSWPTRRQFATSGVVRATNSVLPNFTSKPLAFSARQGGLVLIAGALSYIVKKVRSETISRALYFWINAGPIVAHYKFTEWFLRRTQAPLERRDKVYNELHDKYCNKTLDIILHLKGLYVKIAQVISSRPDFVPPQYIDLFSSAQDSIPQWPIDEVIEIVDKTLDSEFGLEFHDVFESMDPNALGSASIGQVHQAVLKSPFSEYYGGGNVVAVKVMHPGAENRFHHDFQVFRWLCKVALTGWEPILDEFYRQIMTEFDYRREADSLGKVRRYMSESPYSRRIRVPEPLTALCTKELLMMEMLKGKKLSDAIEDELTTALGDRDRASALIKRKRLELILGKEKMKSLDYKMNGLFKQDEKLDLGSRIRLLSLYKKTKKFIDLLVDVQGHQILVNGLFNGDPHPGNILALADGSLGLIDYGQTKSIANSERLKIARVVEALGNGSSNHDIANAMRRLGFETRFDKDEILAKYAALFFDSDAEGKLMGCATPQLYFATLTKSDPLVNVPDVAIFVARASFLLRGMGTLLEKQIRTSARWSTQARKALLEAEKV